MKISLSSFIAIIILLYQIIPLKAESLSEVPTFSGADEGEYIKLSESEGILILSGNKIKMEFDGKTIYSQKVMYSRDTGDVTFFGDVLFDDGTHKIHADKCVFNVEDNAGVLYEASSIERPIFFDTDKIRIVNKKTYITDKIEFSTCDLERPHYHFLVKKLTIYRDKRAIAYNAIYVVGDIPVFYFPFIVHSDEGIGIITQFGQGSRKGDFMQNTMKYTAEDGSKWKYKLDIYEKLGYYGGIEYSKKSRNNSSYIYLAGAKYKYAEWSGTDWVNKPLPEGENDDWFKAILNNDYSFNDRGNSKSYSSIRFEWMNDSYFEKNYEARGEPETTYGMIGFLPEKIDERENLYWIYTIGDKGDNHNISLQLKRRWLWDEYINFNDIDNYGLKGKYVPYVDQLPIFNFTYKDSFFLFDYGDDNNGNKNKQKINWKLNFAGDSYKSYSHGDYYSTTYTPYGYLLLSTDFTFLKFFTYTPGVQNGFIAQWVKGPFDNNESVKTNSEITAEKKTFKYIETSNAVKFGLSNYYLKATHYYRRSYNEEEVVEPFIHEKRNDIVGGIYLIPIPDITMSVTTTYDARRRYPFEDDRLKDITVNNSIFFDFNNLFYSSRLSSNKNAGFYYSGIELTNKYIYIMKDRISGYNTLDVKYTTGNFSLPGIDRINNFEIGYNFFHDYRFSFRDIMSINWRMSTDIFKLWRLEIGAGSQADRAYLLYNNEQNKNFFDELKKSLYFYDKERSKNSVFTLRNLFINIIHDLHCWEIGFYYNLQRKSENWGPQNKDNLIYYEQLFFVSLTLKTFSGRGFQKTQVYPLQQRQEAEY